MPEPTPERTIEQIEARIAEAVSEFAALNLSIDATDDDIAKGESLAAETRELRAELNTRAEARAERERRLAEMNSEMTVPDTPEGVADEPAPPEPEPEPVPEPVAETAPEPMPEPVAAAAQPPAPRPSPARRAAARAPEVVVPETARQNVITAAADVPNYSAGQQFDNLTAAADAVISRARSMPTHGIPGARLRYGALKVQRTGYGDLVQTDGDDYTLVQRTGNEKRLSGGNLAVTADAWCAPSETVYDLCQFETVTGLLSLPEFNVTRGGVRYSDGPDFSAIYTEDDFYFHVTSAGVITDGDGTTVTAKPCGAITCPPFTETRLEVNGVCVSVDILANVGYPELTSRIIEGVLVAHAKKMNSLRISTIEAAAGAAIAVPDNSTFLFNLDYLEWYAEAMRTSYSLADGATVETVLPTWIKPLVRAELARRTGVEAWAVTDQQIRAYFSARGLSTQFVRDWQALTGTPGAVAVPATMKALMYPAGSWTLGTQDVISLDTIYDSALLAQNKYLGLFTEEAWLLIQRCLGTTLLSIPVAVTGQTAAAALTETLGTAGV